MKASKRFVDLVIKGFGILVLAPAGIAGVLLVIVSFLDLIGIDMRTVSSLLPINEALLDFLLILGRMIGGLIVYLSWLFLSRIFKRKTRTKFLAVNGILAESGNDVGKAS